MTKSPHCKILNLNCFSPVFSKAVVGLLIHKHGTWWRIGRVEAFRPEGGGFECRSSCHLGTLGKSLTHSCLWRFGMKLRHSIRAVSEAPLSSSRLEEAL